LGNTAVPLAPCHTQWKKPSNRNEEEVFVAAPASQTTFTVQVHLTGLPVSLDNVLLTSTPPGVHLKSLEAPRHHVTLTPEPPGPVVPKVLVGS